MTHRKGVVRLAGIALVGILGAQWLVDAQSSGAPPAPTTAPAPAGAPAPTTTPPRQVLVEPFPERIGATRAVVTLDFVEFATIPNAGPAPTDWPRMMLLSDEPGTRRIFVNTMQGMLYTVSYDGKMVTPYLDLNDAKWGNPVDSRGSERGFHSFAFHPQFTSRGTLGFGKFYTWADTSNMTPTAEFQPSGEGHTHDTILLEWGVRDPSSATYDGDAPRELFRVADPFPNHNGGQIAFNPLTRAGNAEYGLLYIGLADGGSRGPGDPYNHAQSLASAFGKILRIDPLGRNSKNGKYGVPAANPFASDGKDDTLGEVYAYGMRNPQRFTWDSKTGAMYVADIGDQIVEEVSPVTRGANLGWNKWEGSYRYENRNISLDKPRGDPAFTYPVVEFDHVDPSMVTRYAITGLVIYRRKEIKQLDHLMIFGDNPNGEVFYTDADHLPQGGQRSIGRVLFNDHGTAKTFMQVIRDKNTAQGQPPAPRADMRMGVGPNGQLFFLNKRDGVIRLVVPTRNDSSRR